MIPERSALGKAALDVFFDGHNDVHFYVEDTDQQNAYHAILRRLFPKVKISQVFPLDGKGNVLLHARNSTGNAALTKPQVYIVDKDFDDLLGTVVSLPGLFYLQRYSIENFLLEEDAVLDFIVEVRPKTDRQRLRRLLNFSRLHAQMVSECEHLFRLFVVVQKEGLGLPNVAQTPERFLKDAADARMCVAKIGDYERRVANALAQKASGATRPDVRMLCSSAFPSGEAARHVSGKFLLRFLHLWLVAGKHIGNVDKDVMFYSLARNSSCTGLKGLRTRIQRYLSGSHGRAVTGECARTGGRPTRR